VRVASTNKEKLLLIINEASSIELKLSNMKNDATHKMLDEVELFIGLKVPKQVEVLPHEHSYTKGGGKHIKGGKEKAMKQQQK